MSVGKNKKSPLKATKKCAHTAYTNVAAAAGSAKEKGGAQNEHRKKLPLSTGAKEIQPKERNKKIL